MIPPYCTAYLTTHCAASNLNSAVGVGLTDLIHFVTYLTDKMNNITSD